MSPLWLVGDNNLWTRNDLYHATLTVSHGLWFCSLFQRSSHLFIVAMTTSKALCRLIITRILTVLFSEISLQWLKNKDFVDDLLVHETCTFLKKNSVIENSCPFVRTWKNCLNVKYRYFEKMIEQEKKAKKFITDDKMYFSSI